MNFYFGIWTSFIFSTFENNILNKMLECNKLIKIKQEKMNEEKGWDTHTRLQ